MSPMKTSFIVVILSGAFSVSGCAFTNDVLQHAYDEKAYNDCSKTKRNTSSIHNPQSCSAASNGTRNSKTNGQKDWQKSNTKRKKQAIRRIK